jgi:hypothetical protein
MVWVADFQLMRDEGKNLDSFASNPITTLVIIVATGYPFIFAAMIIWLAPKPTSIGGH